MGKPLYHAAAILFLCVICGGCSICQQCELETYSAYGGRWQRTDRHHGRVGSIFAPAGGVIPYAESAVEGDPAEGGRQSGDAPAEPQSSDPDAAQPEDSVLDEDEAQDLRERQEQLRELQLDDIRLQQ